MSSTRLNSSELARLGIDVLPRLMRTIVVIAHGEDSNIVSMTQFHILKKLSRRQWLVSELAHSLQLSVPTVSVAVDSLVRRGLVERAEAPHDRRAITLRLTPDGQASCDLVLERSMAALRQIVERLPDEDQAALSKGLGAIAIALDEVVPARGNGTSAELC